MHTNGSFHVLPCCCLYVKNGKLELHAMHIFACTQRAECHLRGELHSLCCSTEYISLTVVDGLGTPPAVELLASQKATSGRIVENVSLSAPSKPAHMSAYEKETALV